MIQLRFMLLWATTD